MIQKSVFLSLAAAILASSVQSQEPNELPITWWNCRRIRRQDVEPPIDDNPIHNFENGFEGGEKTIWQRMCDTQTPGVAVAVVVDNKIAWSRGYGHIRRRSNHKVDPGRTLFQAASVSKPFATVGTLKLTEDNEDLSLDDNLLNSPYLTVSIPTRSCLTLPDNFNFTLRSTIRHRSGLIGRGRTAPFRNCDPNGFQEGGGGFAGYYPGRRGVPTLDEIIKGERGSGGFLFGGVNSPAFEFTYDPTDERSSELYYSGEGYTLLQKILEDAAPASFADWMQDSVFDPTNMTRSHYTDDMYESNSTWKPYFDENQVTSGHQGWRVILGERRRYPEHAAAGLYTTAEDLAKAIIMLNNDGVYGETRILESSNAQAMRNGLGTFGGTTGNGNSYYIHDGANSGYRSVFIGFPGLGTGVSVLVNSEANGLLSDILNTVITLYDW